MKNNWKKYGIIIIILAVTFFVVRNKYFYNRLFTEEFCNSITEVQYITYENEIYRITDEKIVRDFADALCNNRYKKLSSVNEGGYTFKLVTEKEIYTFSMTASDIQWKGKEYETKEEFFEIFAEVWEYLDIE